MTCCLLCLMFVVGCKVDVLVLDWLVLSWMLSVIYVVVFSAVCFDFICACFICSILHGVLAVGGLLLVIVVGLRFCRLSLAVFWFDCLF